MSSLTQSRIPNKHGCRPPRGCTLPWYDGCPQVATENDKGSYEAAFLVETGKLYEVFCATVASCATLKAWFSYRLRAQAVKDVLAKQNAMLDFQLTPPVWQTVWSLIQEKGAVWAEQYKKRGLTPVVPKEYSNHWILKLESLTNELSPTDAKEARPRFDFIRLGNRHSAEFVDELQRLFAPLRDQIPQRLQECETLKELCERARTDSARAFDLRVHFGILSERQQAHAKQNLELIRSKHTLAGHAQALLVDMFAPRVNDLGKVLEMEKVLEEVRQAMSQH